MQEKLSCKLKQKKAYTLVEMVIVVAITVILLGISIVGISKLIENLKMVELDDYAKIIYMEAQDQLAVVEVEGGLDAYYQKIRNTYPAAIPGDNLRFLKEIYPVDKYVSDYPMGENPELAKRMWEHMCYLTREDSLATKMISTTSDIYLNGGSYLIEFNPKTGDVYGVFYWESDDEISYETDVKRLDSRKQEDRKERKIGYYGGALAGDLEEKQDPLQNVTLINGEELYLKMSFKKTDDLLVEYSTKLKISVELTGEKGKTVALNAIDLSNNPDVYVDEHSEALDVLDVYMLLDSMYAGHRFNDIVNAGKTGDEQIITPGENLTIKVTTAYTDASGSVTKSVKTVQGNSLFANDTNNDYISISALRHMMNLNGTVYSGDKFATRNTVQYITDVDFLERAYSWDINNSNKAVHKAYGTAKHPMSYVTPEGDTVCYTTPIVNTTLFSHRTDASGSNVNCKVTGKNADMKYALRNFIVEPAMNGATPLDNVGIFGTVTNTDFSNIYVENITVNAADSDNVGALIGYMKDGSITDCGVYLATFGDVNDVITDYCTVDDSMTDASGKSCHTDEMAHRYDTYGINGKNNVGGLVGMAETSAEANAAVTIDKAFAAIKVKGADSYTGGLIGYAHIPSGAGTFTITHSYASGDVTGQDYTGGFAGAVVSEGSAKIVVTDNYATGNVCGTQYFGGFLGKTKMASYDDCTAYGELLKAGADSKLQAGDTAGGFVYSDAATNDVEFGKNSLGQSTCVYMTQPGYNKASTIKNPVGVAGEEYEELISKLALTSVNAAYPYDAELYMQRFPFVKLENQKAHYGNWPEKFNLDTSLVYYEKYEDGKGGYTYGYYCVTAAPGDDNIWLLNTLENKSCIEDGYGLLSTYNLATISYDLYIQNQMVNVNGVANEPDMSVENVPVVTTEDAGKFIRLNKQDELSFKEVGSYDTATGKAGQETAEAFTVKGLYLYQLPYDLQFTEREKVDYVYDRIVLNATAKGGTGQQVIKDLSYLYCPHFAKMAYSVNLEPINPVEKPTNVSVRSARQLNALGRFHYYWNTRHGLSGKVNYIQETDINFSTYTKTYAGQIFDLQAFGETYSNHAIGDAGNHPTRILEKGAFANNYDGRGHKIIDYCLSTSDTQFVGLFGEIGGATLKNIIMVVSSDTETKRAAGEKTNAGLITSNFKTWINIQDNEDKSFLKERRAAVGALVGMAYDNTYCDDFANTIDNCVAAGYTVQYKLTKEGKNPEQTEGSTTIDPLGIVVGGLIGYGESHITNCAAVNDVEIVLEKNYTNTASYYKIADNTVQSYSHDNQGGIVNLGGFVGSYFYDKVENCYSGGTIKVVDGGHTIPHLRVGNFCPGWLDTRSYNLSYLDYKEAEKGQKLCSKGCSTCYGKDNVPNHDNCLRTAETFRSFEYVNCYTYTSISDSIWDVASKTMSYVPFASRKVDYFQRDNNSGYWKMANDLDAVDDAEDAEFIPEKYTTFENAYYVDAVADKGLATDPTNAQGTSLTCDELSNKRTIILTQEKTFANADDKASAAYPYQPVICEIGANGEKTNSYVHYGDWFTPVLQDTSLTYYERYEDDTYGYYCVITDENKKETWVLDTLKKDEACVEDGYALFSKYNLKTLSYTVSDKNSVEISLVDENGSPKYLDTPDSLRFKKYEKYDEILGEAKNSQNESVNAGGLYTYLYKLPFELQCDDVFDTTDFYKKLTFSGTVDNGTENGQTVINNLSCYYNPHFAKAAINPAKTQEFTYPTNIYVRSARQLNALGRFSNYWGRKGGSGKDAQITYIQETDINFSTYAYDKDTGTKSYLGKPFDLQKFGLTVDGKNYANQAIGKSKEYQFKNTYDGRGNLIVDYCLDGGTGNVYTGLFGEIFTATLKNIVMVVSSETETKRATGIPTDAGIITSSFTIYANNIKYGRPGVGALVGSAQRNKNGTSNTIENCTVSGYTVQYVLTKDDGRILEPISMAVGGLAGFSMSPISNCTATNDVKIILREDYDSTAENNDGGRVYLGGFVGSQMYDTINNCYSGGTIEVVNDTGQDKCKIPYLRVGSFCPGWLDLPKTDSSGGYAVQYRDNKNKDWSENGKKVGYTNVYSYTKVSDSVWKVDSASMIYVPLVSTVVEHYLDDNYITESIETRKIRFVETNKNNTNVYLDELTAAHLDKTSSESKKYYMENEVNFTATATTLEALAKDATVKVTVTDDTTNTFKKGSVENGKWSLTPEKIPYPYPAVIRNVDKNGNFIKDQNDKDTYAHYGEWLELTLPENILTYYEKYGDGTYGYYSVVSDSKDSKKTWILDTLRDEACVEDGYGLLTKNQWSDISYTPNGGEAVEGATFVSGTVTDRLLFSAYQEYDPTYATVKWSLNESIGANSLYTNLYKLPFELQNDDVFNTENFYKQITFSGRVSGTNAGGSTVTMTAYYIPHFAKAALNIQPAAGETWGNPMNVYVRSARQLNALGRFKYYWRTLLPGHVNLETTYIQETDINFSTYGAYTFDGGYGIGDNGLRQYAGREFDLQAFDTDYSNHTIGTSGNDNWFRNTYDGRGNLIIDYCLDSGTDIMFTGLFGELLEAELKNIVMVVSSETEAKRAAGIPTNAGLITSSFIKDTSKTNELDRAGVGALLGIAYRDEGGDRTSVIENCAVSGYIVQYVLSDVAERDYDPSGIAVGGLVGFSQSPISNCTAANDVKIILEKNYNNTKAADESGIVYLGGFVGSQMYAKVKNCYSGGTIDVQYQDEKGTYQIPKLRVGAFCPGWLDVSKLNNYKVDYYSSYKDRNERKLVYVNNYAYTKVSDSVWDVGADSMIYVPLVSTLVDWYGKDTGETVARWHTESIGNVKTPWGENKIGILFADEKDADGNEKITNLYLEEVTATHLDKMDKVSPAAKAYYTHNGENFTASKITLDELKALAKDPTKNSVTVTEDVNGNINTNTFINKGLNQEGGWKLLAEEEAYPYPAVIRKVGEDGNYIKVSEDKDTYAHYGAWLKHPLPDASLTYYEKYEDGKGGYTYGYYSVVSDPNGDKTWVLDTLNYDRACVEDGYGLLTKHNLDGASLSYALNGGATATMQNLVAAEAEKRLWFRAYENYNEILGEAQTSVGESISADGLYTRLYKLPFQLQNDDVLNANKDFYAQIRISGTVDGEVASGETADGEAANEATLAVNAYYNPHFAKAALNLGSNASAPSNPTNVYVRSARQLNALGRFPNYYGMKGGSDSNQKVTYIQETDINFSTYGSYEYDGAYGIYDDGERKYRKYAGEEFDLQAFGPRADGKNYSNHVIGSSTKRFNNIYDGRSNLIIDYCVDGGIDTQNTGLFGEIENATLRNIIMVVSSKRDSMGVITSSYKITIDIPGMSRDAYMRSGVGALVGMAYETGNTIENCAVSGYTVQYVMKEGGIFDPIAVAIGGLAGFSQSPISNSTAANDVKMVLKKDYDNSWAANHGKFHKLARVYLGGFVGSQMCTKVTNCYSGGTIDVLDKDENGKYKIPYLRVGGFCPGSLDTKEYTYEKFETNKNLIVGYENVYSYTKVSDGIWDVDSESKIYVPLVSSLGEHFTYGHHWFTYDIRTDAGEDRISFNNNLYLEEVTAHHLEKMDEVLPTAKSYYEGGVNVIANKITLDELTALAKDSTKNSVTVTEDGNGNINTNTFINRGLNQEGSWKLLAEDKAYPYPAVIRKVDQNGNYIVTEEKDTYAHYGAWLRHPLPDASLTYYEKYEDGKGGYTYGYYSVVSDPDEDKTWVLDTLKYDRACVEDGYGLLTKHNLDGVSLSYALNGGKPATMQNLTAAETEKRLWFRAYESYNEILGEAQNSVGESISADGLYTRLYKLPFQLQNDDVLNENKDFYAQISISGTVNGEVASGEAADGEAVNEATLAVNAYYNPHFAKAALNVKLADGITLKNPTNVYVRSARQLNALGRFDNYWDQKGGSEKNEQITYIQESDINFSTYGSYEYDGAYGIEDDGERKYRKYAREEFDLQAFGPRADGKDYSNHAIGESHYTKLFQNNYDGRSNRIIDYCLDGGLDTQYVGLFGSIKDATIKNIVMVVSAEPASKNAGVITSTYQPPKGQNAKRVGVGAIFGMTSETNFNKYSTNTITNCAVSGYTVRYELNPHTEERYDPYGIAIGGFAGFNLGNVSDCSAANHVELTLNKDYDQTNKGDGIAYLGGFVGSQMYTSIKNCYSGGTIKVNNLDKYTVPYKVSVGGFCPGWLDTQASSAGGLYLSYKGRAVDAGQIVGYSNVYSYTQVEESLVSNAQCYYVPLISRMVARKFASDWEVEDITLGGEDKIFFTKDTNIYVKEVTEANLAKAFSETKKDENEEMKVYPKSFYETDGVNFTAQEKTLSELAADATPKVAEDHSFINKGLNDAGGWELQPEDEDYLYPAVVRQADENGQVPDEVTDTTPYVHYGEWIKPLQFDGMLTYYEEYADGFRGYYSVMPDPDNSSNTWVLNTLREEACIEDGYGLITSRTDLGTITCKANQVTGKMNSGEQMQGVLNFRVYDEAYDTIKGEPAGNLVESFMESGRGSYLYKLPYELQCGSATDLLSGTNFYANLVLSDGSGAEILSCYYNPHFAKTAINPGTTAALSNPTNVYVRSARQLNRLGHNEVYWNRIGGSGKDAEITFIQETDINFSTYVKGDYAGSKSLPESINFDLQAFDTANSNRVIGTGGKQFMNTYDGRSNLIIDYCIDGGKTTPYTGLFGEIWQATLKNIVMVVSSEENQRGEKAGLITSSFITDTDLGRAGVGALVGSAQKAGSAEEAGAGAGKSNTIENCSVSGYTVQYVLANRAETNPHDPTAIAVGGLAGFSMSPISNSTAVNDVKVILEQNYTSDGYKAEKAYCGAVYLGGFVGSQMYDAVTNCYSGGTIDVESNSYTIPKLRVGGFCPGWLDIGRIYPKSGYGNYWVSYKKVTDKTCIVAYDNVYSYTKVLDSVWNVVPNNTMYVPLVSNLVEYYENEWTTASIDKDDIRFGDTAGNLNNTYLDELTAYHLARATSDMTKYYQNGSVNFTAKKDTLASLAEHAAPKVAADNSYINRNLNTDGSWVLSPETKDYPYPAVIREVENGNLTDTYVHYGAWIEPDLPDTVLAYYEQYGDNTYGYYSVESDPLGNPTWVLDTLKDEACVEDGYGLLSKFDVGQASYNLYVAGQGSAVAGNTLAKQAMGGSVFANDELQYLYKLPFEQQFNEYDGITRNNFYDKIVFNASTAGGENVISGLTCYYNPLFAKTAINAKEGGVYNTPTDIYVRSARQLNALGRNNYYWNLKGGNGGKVTFIQETDINFSTYVKGDYAGSQSLPEPINFDLQEFGTDYSNRPIGEIYFNCTGEGAGGTYYSHAFTNIYDGRSNRIIDYCLDGGTETHYTGLFGEIRDATLKNIVMVVSSNPNGEGGLITSSYHTKQLGKSYIYAVTRENRAGVGALLGMANGDSGANTITNCVASGYTVKYHLIQDDKVKDVSNILNAGDLMQPMGIAIGGLIGYATNDISNCAAVNTVVIELEDNYEKTYDNYLNRDTPNYIRGSGGIVYMGGFVGSFMSGSVTDCYSGGTIQVADKGWKIPQLRVGSFCPGWLDMMRWYNNAPENHSYYEDYTVAQDTFQFKYSNVYSYTEVSDHIWDVNTTTTRYVPLVSRMLDYYDRGHYKENDTGSHEKWYRDQMIEEADATFTGSYYLQELSDSHLIRVLNDESDIPEKFYPEYGGNTSAVSSLTCEGLSAVEGNRATAPNTYLADAYTNGGLSSSPEAYPYPAVIREVDENGKLTDTYVHYGSWYDGEDKKNLIKEYPTYYEEYEDGYGFYYIDEKGTAVSSNITTDHTKKILSTGYGFLTVVPERVNVNIRKANVDVNGTTYYLHASDETELQGLLQNIGSNRYWYFEMEYSESVTDTIFINPGFGLALGTSDSQIGKERYPLQVRTKEHLQNLGATGSTIYYKQTHDIDLAGGHTPVTLSYNCYYDGSSDELGCVIRNATNTIFNENKGEIVNCTVLDMAIQGTKAYGFAVTNNGTISNCHVEGTVTGTEEAAGFVGSNGALCTITGSTVSLVNNGSAAAVQGTKAYGFAVTNDGTISNCHVEAVVTGTEEAAGFVGSNGTSDAVGTITNCSVYIANNDTTAGIQGKIACGFATTNNWDSIMKECYVYGTESGIKNGSIKATVTATGFVYMNGGLITDSYVRGMNGYEDVVIQAPEACGFVYSNNSIIEKSYVVATVTGESCAAGFAYSNNTVVDIQVDNPQYGIANCYANAKVSATSSWGSASGFAQWSGSPTQEDGEDHWVKNCYAAGTVSGTYTYGFAYSAYAVDCYTIVNHDGGTNRHATTDPRFDYTNEANGIRWGYDEATNFNLPDAMINSYTMEGVKYISKGIAMTLADLDSAATDTAAVPFNTQLGTQYPYANYGLTHYGDWPVSSVSTNP